MKKKKINIEVPQSWHSVSLKKYLNLQKDIETYKDDEVALTSTLLYHLCDIEPTIIPQLDVKLLSNIRKDLNSFLNNTEYPLQRFITIGGIEYGFEPDLSNMSYGAYLDVSKWDKFTIDENWAYICNVLYRPVEHKSGSLYSIKPYSGNGDKDKEKWLELDMEFHFGVFFYFITLLTDLFHAILNYLKKEKNLPPDLRSTLEESGKVTHQLKHLLAVTS